MDKAFCLRHNRCWWWCPLSRACWVIESSWCFRSWSSFCSCPLQDLNQFRCFRSWASFCSRPFQDLNLLLWWRCFDFPNSCPLQHRVTNQNFPLLGVFKSVPSYKWSMQPLSEAIATALRLITKRFSKNQLAQPRKPFLPRAMRSWAKHDGHGNPLSWPWPAGCLADKLISENK